MNGFDKREIVLSCAIGDGCIHKRKSLSGLKYNYSLSLIHSESQKDYLEWKNNLIYCTGIFSSKANIYTYYTKLNNKLFLQHRSVWCNKKVLIKYYDYIYEEGKKTTYKVLDFLNNPIALAILFMDDGSVFKRKRKHKDGSIYFLRPSMKLCTHSFNLKDNELILKWLKDKFDIEGYIVIERKKNREGQPEYYTLNFNCENTEKIWKLIRVYVEEVASMRKKFNFIRTYYM